MKINTIITAHSIHIIAFLLMGIILGSILAGLFIQHNPVLDQTDRFLYGLIHHNNHHPFIDLLITPFNFNFLPPELSPGHMPSYYYFMFLLPLIYLLLKKRNLVPWYILSFFLGTFIAYFITALDWHFVFRERPFESLPSYVDNIGKSAWQNLSSYPSGHARETALYATLITAYLPKLKWLMLIFVIFIAYSRVYIGAHFVTDVIAGVLIGYFTAKTTLIISRELQLITQGKKDKSAHSTKPKNEKNS